MKPERTFSSSAGSAAVITAEIRLNSTTPSAAKPTLPHEGRFAARKRVKTKSGEPGSDSSEPGSNGSQTVMCVL
jgi:hypothetical protein